MDNHILKLGFCRFLWVVPIKTNVENAENSDVFSSKINLPLRLCGHPEKTAGVIREIIRFLFSIRRKRNNKITEVKTEAVANRTA